MRNALRHIFFFCIGILPLAGQTEPGGDNKRDAGRTAWFVYTDMPAGVENPIKLMSGDEITELKLSQYMASDAVRIPVDGIIRIVRSIPDTVDPAKEKYLALGEAKIAADIREALIILMPLGKPEGDRIFLAKVQDLASFKGGDRLFINLSESEIRVNLGSTKVTVAPNQANIYETPVLAKPTNIPIMYEFFHPEQNKWKILSASTVVLRPTRREICIFNNGTRLGSIKKHGIIFPVQNENP